MSSGLALLGAASAGAILAGTTVALASGSDGGRTDVEVFDYTSEDDGAVYRCLVSSSGLWCERTFRIDAPSHDCGPNGDLECGTPSVEREGRT